MNLIRMRFIIENFPCCMDGISDDDDFGHVLFIICLVDTTPNSEEFCFGTSDKHYIINRLDQRMVD